MAATKFKSNQINDVDWPIITNHPTTISGYGITDGATQQDINKIDVFLIGGQSNALGSPDDGPTVNYVVPAGVAYQYYLGNISPVTTTVGGATGCAWTAFAVTYYQKTGRKILFVPAAKGGSGQITASDTGNGNWGTSGSLFSTSVTLANSAIALATSQGYKPNFKGILWAQGENDATAIFNGLMTKADYYNGLSTMVANYRISFSDNNLPFEIFKIGVFGPDPDVFTGPIAQAQEDFVQADKHTFFGSKLARSFYRQGIMRSDNLHYKQAAYDMQGVSGASEFIAQDKYNILTSEGDRYGIGVGSTASLSSLLQVGKNTVNNLINGISFADTLNNNTINSGIAGIFNQTIINLTQASSSQHAGIKNLVTYSGSVASTGDGTTNGGLISASLNRLTNTNSSATDVATSGYYGLINSGGTITAGYGALIAAASGTGITNVVGLAIKSNTVGSVNIDLLLGPTGDLKTFTGLSGNYSLVSQSNKNVLINGATVINNTIQSSTNINAIGRLVVGSNNLAPGATVLINPSSYSTAVEYSVTGFGLQIGNTTFTSNGASSTVADVGVNTIAIPTLASGASKTLTRASTLRIAGAPIQGTNTFITQPLSLDIAAGNSHFAGNVQNDVLTASLAVFTDANKNLVTRALTGVSSSSVVLSDSPTLIGVPLAPTASVATNTAQIATTSFVNSYIAANIKWGFGIVTPNGSQTVFTIPHGAGFTPSSISITFGDATDSNLALSKRDVDATNITLTCTNPPLAAPTSKIWFQVFK